MLSILFFALGLGRIRNSFDRLPVDPGYEFFEDTYTFGISVLLKTEGGYLDIPRRIFAEVVTSFPIRQTGNVGSLIWLLMVSATAVFVVVMMKRIHPSKILAIACGACVVLVPSASESQIGNQSVVKWFLILIAIFAVSLPEEHQLSDRFTASLVLLSGVSNPMTIIIIAPLALSIARNRKLLKSQRTKLIVVERQLLRRKDPIGRKILEQGVALLHHTLVLQQTIQIDAVALGHHAVQKLPTQGTSFRQ